MNAPWDDWKEAETDLGLEIEAPAIVALSSGKKFLGDFLLKNFGGKSGMLIVQNYDRFAGYWEELEKLGYGFSTLEPSSRETYVDKISSKCLATGAGRAMPKRNLSG
jgi:hypothetical protein